MCFYIEKHINNFYKRYSECKDCNIKRGVSRYYDTEDKISLQEIIYYEKKRDKRDKSDRKKLITETKETQIIKNYLHPMLNYKIN